MYISNRKNAFKLLKTKRNGDIVICNRYGAITTQPKKALDESGYKIVKYIPDNRRS